MKSFFTCLLALAVVATVAQKKPKITQAKSALEKGEYAEAKLIVDAAIDHEKTKEDPMTWFIRAQVYAALDTASGEEGAFEMAMQAFDKTMELDPEQKKISAIDYTTGSISNVDSKKQGYYAYYYNQAISYYNEKSFQEAANNFEASFYIMPSDTNAILNAAYAAGAADNKEQAKRNYLAALEAGSTDKNIYLQLYNYALQEENKEEALAFIKKGREAFPTDVDLMKYEVNMYIQMEKKDEAKKGIEEAIASDPENADLYFTLGVLNDEAGDNEAAVEAYNKAIGIDADHFNANFNLGVIAYNKVGALIKEQGTLNYYPGQSRPNMNEKKKYEQLNKDIQVELRNALPYWEKLSTLDGTDENVVNTLADIKSRIK